ncbi:MAG: NAD(P)/FAD-dependent oxidoreductase [Cyanobacteria bacterium P01_E01_bin.45]
MATSPLRVGIVGAGSSGVYLAHLLSRFNVDITLFERSSYPRAEGCGILLVSSGMEALFEGDAGLCSAIVDSGAIARTYEFRNMRDRLVNSHIAEYKGDEQPSVLVHRGKILDALLDRLDPSCLLTNAKLVNTTQTDADITAHFADGSTWTGDVLVGADGIFSTVREAVVPNVRPRYLGDVVWRGIVPDTEFCRDGNFIVYMRSRGVYANFFDLGGGYTHWGFFIEKEQTGDDRARSTPQDVSMPAEELAKIPDAPRTIIEGTNPADIKCRFSYDLDMLPCIRNGRIILIGDAAHAKSPTRARGMTSGLEDALSLSRYIAESTPDAIQQSLADFQSERLPINHEYQRSSREISRKVGRKRPLPGAAMATKTAISRSME